MYSFFFTLLHFEATRLSPVVVFIHFNTEKSFKPVSSSLLYIGNLKCYKFIVVAFLVSFLSSFQPIYKSDVLF